MRKPNLNKSKFNSVIGMFGALSLSLLAVGCGSSGGQNLSEETPHGNTVATVQASPAQATGPLVVKDREFRLKKAFKRVIPYTAQLPDINVVKKNPGLRLKLVYELNTMHQQVTIAGKRAQLGAILKNPDAIFGALDPVEKNAALRTMVSGFVNDALSSLPASTLASLTASPSQGAPAASGNAQGAGSFQLGSRSVRAEDEGEGSGPDNSGGECLSCGNEGTGSDTTNSASTVANGVIANGTSSLEKELNELSAQLNDEQTLDQIGGELNSALDELNFQFTYFVEQMKLIESQLNASLPSTLDQVEHSPLLEITSVKTSEDPNSVSAPINVGGVAIPSSSQAAFLARSNGKGGGGIQAFAADGVAGSQDPNAAGSRTSGPLANVPLRGGQQGVPGMGCDGMDCP